jgi:adenine-specific DNA-methyltransferase
MVGTNSGPSSAYLKIAGVQQALKEDKIIFTSLAPWPGEYICAEGRYTEADRSEKRAGIFIGPELGTVPREDQVAAAREPDIEIQDGGSGQVKVKVRGVDVFHPSTGEVRSNGPDEIACWFIDTDYKEESFFVRHAYFLGANDPYKALKTRLKAEIDEDAWASLRSDTSRAFDKPESGRIAVKVINHLGDEVMKVFRVTP